MSRPSNREIVGDLVVQVRCAGLDESIAKAQQLVEKLKEARTLVGELASDLGKLEIEIKS